MSWTKWVWTKFMGLIFCILSQLPAYPVQEVLPVSSPAAGERRLPLVRSTVPVAEPGKVDNGEEQGADEQRPTGQLDEERVAAVLLHFNILSKNHFK
jgi:hypothetical protein